MKITDTEKDRLPRRGFLPVKRSVNKCFSVWDENLDWWEANKSRMTNILIQRQRKKDASQ